MHVTSKLGIFVDRDEELKALNRAWRERPGLVIVYGRRRIGKTRLIMEWLRARNGTLKHTYYHAVPAKHEVNLSGLAHSMEEHLGIKGLGAASFNSLDSLLELATQYVGDAVIVIDEFTYWVRAEPRVVGELQRFTDHVLPRTKVLLVLAGSLVGVMFRDVLGGGSPLYGRASFRLRLGELPLRDLSKFYPSKDVEEVFLAYAAFGGVPYYHVLARKYSNVTEALWDLFLTPTARLRDEVSFMLREEFREPSTYYSVIKAIASGADTPSKIGEVTGIHRQHVSKYLAVLEALGLVGRERPLFSKKGRYVVKDKLLLTWFNIVEPVMTRDPNPSAEEVLPEIKEKMRAQASKVLEEVATRFARVWGRERGVRFDDVGRFIHKGVEVDVVAISRARKEVHLFEVKWAKLDEGEVRRVATLLKRKSTYLPASLSEYEVVPHVVLRKYVGGKEAVADVKIHELEEVVKLI